MPDTVAPETRKPPDDVDVIVAGAGAVGLCLGIALARQGLSVLLAGRVEAPRKGRTVALLEGSVRLLDHLLAWPHLVANVAPLRAMRIVDDTGSLFRVPPVRFEAREIGREAFGYNIENAHLVRGLAEIARTVPNLTMFEQHLSTFAFGNEAVSVQTDDGRAFRAPVLAAADGRRSPARRAAGISVRAWSYPQVALTALLRHERPHHATSTEFHTRAGPFTLVPLPGTADAPHRSSLVWVMTPPASRRRSDLDRAALGSEIERQSRHLLGGMLLEDAPGSFPIAGMASRHLTGRRVVLAGEAAHALPPIGAQGLNLGLRDVGSLALVLGEAHRRGEDLGGSAVLDRYVRARRGDVALRTVGVDALNRALITNLLPVDLLRGAGLLALGSIGPLRRWMMREGMSPRVTAGSF